MRKKKKSIQVFSYGGCGSRLVTDFLKKNSNYHVLPHSHQANPPSKKEKNFKAIYLFRNPVYSFKPVRLHCKHMQGEWKKIKIISEAGAQFIDLKDYFEKGLDNYGYEKHFDNWTSESNEQKKYQILLIKFESLWENLEMLLDFCEIPKEKAELFPSSREQKHRKWRQKKAETSEQDIQTFENYKSQLETLYARLIEKVENSPGAWILGGKTD